MKWYVLSILMILFSIGCSVKAEATVLVSATDNSSRVLSPGKPINLHLVVHNIERISLSGVLTVELSDFQDRLTDTATVSLGVAPGEDQQVTIALRNPGVGYYSVAASVKRGNISVFSGDTLWSVAVLGNTPPTPPDSPFGTYIIGNTGLLVEIEPKGFFSDMARMGARWGTLDTWWSNLEPEKGKYTWEYYDPWFDRARAQGIIPIPHLFGIPKWISSAPDKENYWAYPPRDWAAWENFVKDFVTHYKEWLVYLRIWNEPNCGYWQGTPAEYAQMVIHASRAAKAVHPEIKIIIEAVANTRLDVIPFFDAVDAAGATPYWDVLAVHNYWLNHKDFPERTQFIKTYQDVVRWRDAHKPGAAVWDTEFTCMADDWGAEWFGVGEVKQAQWLARAHVLGLSLGLAKTFWFPGYSWPDYETTPYYNPSGLLRTDLSPRPAYVAYRTVTAALAQAHFAEMLTPGIDQYAAVFKTPEGFTTALWSVDARHGGPVRLVFGKGASIRKTQLMGTEQMFMAEGESGEITVEIGETMIFIASPEKPAIAPK